MKETSIATMNLGGNFHGSLFDMVLNAGIIVQLVLLLLFIFSVVSWAIILMKYVALRKINKENDRFLDVYMKGAKLSEIYPESKKMKHSTLAGVFNSGYKELVKIARSAQETSTGKATADAPLANLEIGAIDNVERSLNRACTLEAAKLETALGFLATTGSASPFVGLFGTVWGIMDTFKSIGARGSATLAVVAPGISEALVATAAGLAAAIPAVIFYNFYLNKVKGMTAEMEGFSSELINIIERFYVRK